MMAAMTLSLKMIAVSIRPGSDGASDVGLNSEREAEVAEGHRRALILGSLFGQLCACS